MHYAFSYTNIVSKDMGKSLSHSYIANGTVRQYLKADTAVSETCEAKGVYKITPPSKSIYRKRGFKN